MKEHTSNYPKTLVSPFAYDGHKFQLRFKKRNLQDIFLALQITNFEIYMQMLMFNQFMQKDLQIFCSETDLMYNQFMQKDLQDFTVGIPVKYHHIS